MSNVTAVVMLFVGILLFHAYQIPICSGYSVSEYWHVRGGRLLTLSKGFFFAALAAALLAFFAPMAAGVLSVSLAAIHVGLSISQFRARK